MKIAEERIELVTDERRILEEFLELQGAAVLELGCGKAEKTRIVAEKAATVLALEVDEIQLSINQAISDLPNVRFAKGCAEQISAGEESFDLVTHSDHVLSAETREAVKTAFGKHMTKTGADFFMPIRVDFLEKRA